jgi:DNA-directed RNA polymerase specialized sigma24 family protein
MVLAWEAVEELLASIPESSTKDVLRMVAAGLPLDEIAERLGLAVADVEVLAARGRIRILTAAIYQQAGTPNAAIPTAESPALE